MTNQITVAPLGTLDAEYVLRLLFAQAEIIGEVGSSSRSLSAKNRYSAYKKFASFIEAEGWPLPNNSVLERWKDRQIQSGDAINSINSRLAAVRKLYEETALNAESLGLKMHLRDWARVKDVKQTVDMDRLEESYGRRFTVAALQELYASIPNNLKGYRDRAIISLSVGAGLRVSEVCNLTWKRAFETYNELKQRGIHIYRSKHNKSRVVALGGSWVLDHLQAYHDLCQPFNKSHFVIRGLVRVKGGYRDSGFPLSKENIAVAACSYPVLYAGEYVTPSHHDFRRTYAKLCRVSGMDWDGIRRNLGHATIEETQRYVGEIEDWEFRQPNWSIIA